MTDKRQPPTDLIAVNWAETLSRGEQSVLLTSSLRRLQAMINAAVSSSERRCAECEHSNVGSSGLCLENLSDLKTVFKPCGCKCVFPATGAAKSDFKVFLAEQMQDPEFRAAYEQISAEEDVKLAATGAGEGERRERKLLAAALGVIEQSIRPSVVTEGELRLPKYLARLKHAILAYPPVPVAEGEPMPRRYCNVHQREEFKYESLEHELTVADETQRRADAVVDTAIEWHESGQEGDCTWFDKSELLSKAIEALLELRTTIAVRECFCGTELEAGICPNGHDPVAPTAAPVVEAPQDGPAAKAWREWFRRLGDRATPDVVNATATLVIEERHLLSEASKP